jgi:hypothetical protein
VVENAFGILANRFQLLQKDINLSVAKVQNITLTCCVLHNFIKRRDGKRYLYGMDHENTTAATSLMFHFILLFTVTIFLLCCLSLCCFVNKLQALFYCKPLTFV